MIGFPQLECRLTLGSTVSFPYRPPSYLKKYSGLHHFGQAIDAVRLGPAGQDTDILLGSLLARQSWFYSTLGHPDIGKTVAEESISILRRSKRKDDVLIGLDSLLVTYFMINSDWLFRGFKEGGQQDPEFTHPAAVFGSILGLNLLRSRS